jgi:hypothetical protein
MYGDRIGSSDNNPNYIGNATPTETDTASTETDDSNTQNSEVYDSWKKYLEGQGTWAESALETLWNSAKDAVSTDQSQNEAAKSLTDLLSSTGSSMSFYDTLKQYTDEGYTSEAAKSKTIDSFKNVIDTSDMSDEDKLKAHSYLETVSQSDKTSEDPTSFDFFMEQFANTKEGQDIMKSMFDGSAQYTKNQYNKLAAEVDTQNNLLDSLIEQSNTGTGLFSPASFTINGRQVDFVPKSQKAIASMLEELGQKKVENASTLFGSGYAIDKLLEDARQANVADENQDNKTEAEEPGVLDYVKGIASLADPTGGIISSIIGSIF